MTQGKKMKINGIDYNYIGGHGLIMPAPTFIKSEEEKLSQSKTVNQNKHPIMPAPVMDKITKKKMKA